MGTPNTCTKVEDLPPSQNKMTTGWEAQLSLIVLRCLCQRDVERTLLPTLVNFHWRELAYRPATIKWILGHFHPLPVSRPLRVSMTFRWGELLINFFQFYTRDFDWRRHAVCMRKCLGVRRHPTKRTACRWYSKGVHSILSSHGDNK